MLFICIVNVASISIWPYVGLSSYSYSTVAPRNKTKIQINLYSHLNSGGRVAGNSLMCGLDVLQGTDSSRVRLHLRERSHVHAHIASPGQNNVQIGIRHSEGVAHNELLVANQMVLQICQLLSGFGLEVCLDVRCEARIEQSADGRMHLSTDVTQSILKEGTLSGAIKWGNLARCLCKSVAIMLYSVVY